MTDFMQQGNISTFHNLKTKLDVDLENEIKAFSMHRPVSLVIPCLFSELEKPALANIIKELSSVEYLKEVVIGLDNASEAQFHYTVDYFRDLKQPHSILWHDGPNLTKLDKELAKHGLAPPEPGKGRNVWYCFGYALASQKSEVVALHDADITTYKKEMLNKLVYPVVNPNFSYIFCKGYYPRIHEGKLGGRVVRLLVVPLLKALKKMFGDNEYLNYLQSFRYPLAGEFAMRTSALSNLRIPSDWGLEIGVLSEMWRNYSTKVISQVDISDTYDHKHQDLSKENANKGLSRMSSDITKAIFRKLATDGAVFSQEHFRTIKATYYREALDFIDIYYDASLMNGLSVDRHVEEEAVELFAQNIVNAGQEFLENPMDTPFMPSWRRVNEALPDLLSKINSAVKQDNS